MDTPVRNEPLPTAGAFFESFDGWAQLLKAQALGATEGAGAEPLPAEDSGTAETVPRGEPEAAEALPWRPGRRAAMALLHVVDDGLRVSVLYLILYMFGQGLPSTNGFAHFDARLELIQHFDMCPPPQFSTTPS
jgi:hypothetical protein